MKSNSAALLAAFLLCGVFCIAQVQRGSISGTVFDSQGAVVPSAVVSVIDAGTGAVSTVKTSNEGAFTVPGLPLGTYSVKVIAAGFRQWEATNVQVITAQDSSLRAMLEIGGANEVVTVTEVQTPIDSTSSELKTHVDRKQIMDLPSTTRNPLDFATQMAGVTSTWSRYCRVVCDERTARFQ